MPRKIHTQTFIGAESLTINSDFLSERLDISDSLGYSIQIKITEVSGPLSLNASIQVANNDSMPLINLPDSSLAITGSVDHLWEVTTGYYNRFALNISHTSGTYELTVIYAVKG